MTTVSAKLNWMAYSELPWRPFLGYQAWRWTTLRGNVFLLRLQTFFICVTFFAFLTFFSFLFECFLYQRVHLRQSNQVICLPVRSSCTSRRTPNPVDGTQTCQMCGLALDMPTKLVVLVAAKSLEEPNNYLQSVHLQTYSAITTVR